MEANLDNYGGKSATYPATQPLPAFIQIKKKPDHNDLTRKTFISALRAGRICNLKHCYKPPHFFILLKIPRLCCTMWKFFTARKSSRQSKYRDANPVSLFLFNNIDLDEVINNAKITQAIPEWDCQE